MQLSSVMLWLNTICPLVEPQNLQASGHILLVRWNVNGLCYINGLVLLLNCWSSIEALKMVVCCWRGVGYSNKLAKSYILLEAKT